MEETKKKLIEAIGVLSEKINKELKADDALKFTQAALNAANTIRCLTN